jgi:hypothetical protein
MMSQRIWAAVVGMSAEVSRGNRIKVKGRNRMKTFRIAVACLFSIVAIQTSQAQDFGGGLGQIVHDNVAFDAAMQQRAADIAQQFLQDRTAYRMQTGDWSYIPGPVSAADVSRSISEMNDAFQRYNDSWHQTSARQSAALERWSTAFRGDWYYTNPQTGQTVTLPYAANSYTYDPQSGYVPGYNYGGNSFTPSNGYGD